MISLSTIQARRDALQAQLDQARAQYDQLEATLKEIDRQLCGMAGGLQELDRLLAEDAALSIASNGDHISTYATGLNEAHESALEGESLARE